MTMRKIKEKTEWEPEKKHFEENRAAIKNGYLFLISISESATLDNGRFK